MPKKLGITAIAAACLLAVAAPVFADDSTPETTTTTELSATTTIASTVPEPDEPAPTTRIDELLDVSSQRIVDGPAIVDNRTPTRGTQLQIVPPPPPPPDAFDPPANSGFGRRVVYSKSKQTVWVYDATNTIIKMHRVSGRQDPNDPTPGTYRVWSRSIRTFSINNPSITWGHMVRFAKGDRGGNIGFHDIPYQYGRPVQTTDQLGQALSGGCVRQAYDDAVWMWNWAQLGTVVVVTP